MCSWSRVLTFYCFPFYCLCKYRYKYKLLQIILLII
nr:MAG TPA: hypothetical protein [Caudoviricetes sp.]DAI92047.1 MAG TPA: hypothetical protein [Caudoviricetes sp.]